MTENEKSGLVATTQITSAINILQWSKRCRADAMPTEKRTHLNVKMVVFVIVVCCSVGISSFALKYTLNHVIDVIVAIRLDVSCAVVYMGSKLPANARIIFICALVISIFNCCYYYYSCTPCTIVHCLIIFLWSRCIGTARTRYLLWNMLVSSAPSWISVIFISKNVLLSRRCCSFNYYSFRK